MAKPIDHSFSSGTATIARRTGLGAIVGAIAGVVGPPAALGLLFAGGAALVGVIGLTVASVMTFGAVSLSMFSIGGALAVGVMGAVGATIGLAGSIPGFGIGTWSGLGIGAASGVRKVVVEKSTFNRKAELAAQSQQGMHAEELQQAYAAGAQDQRNYMVGQLRQLQEQAMMADALKAKGGHVTKVCQDREAQAAAVKQI